MSGFCGFTGIEPDQAQTLINTMVGAIAHRTMGKENTYIGEGIAIGGTQPPPPKCEEEMPFLKIFSDGNIYNLADLYKNYGTNMPEHIDQAFTFAIYDGDKLFCARDSFGVKPFYYTVLEGQLVFGSEIKAITQHPQFTATVNREALAQYLTFQYSVLNHTFFEGVYKLPPGHSLLWENNCLHIEKWHDGHTFQPQRIDEDKAIEAIDKAVCQSVASLTDEETGAFLSGGVDSSYLAATFPGKKTFTVGFDYQNYNEIHHAKSLSDHLGLHHITRLVTTQEYWDALPKIQYHLDEPMGDPAAVAFYFACEEAAKHVSVAISGEGADEFFGGYNIYKEPLSLARYTWLPRWLRKFLAQVAQKLPPKVKGRNFLIRGATPVEERFMGNAYIFTKAERDRILKAPSQTSPLDVTQPHYQQAKAHDDVTKMQHLDLQLWLPDDILLQGNKLSMAHGLEVRMPFMDINVFNAAATLPTPLRVTRKSTKVAFRAAAARHLPKETATRYKLGFPVPIRIWLREEKYYHIVKSYFASETAETYFVTGEILALLEDHFTGRQDNSRKIWTIYMFLLWCEAFITERTNHI